MVALQLASIHGVALAQPKPGVAGKAVAKPAPQGGEGAPSSSWVADELRILRAELESIRQRPDSNLSSELAALRAELTKLAGAQAELERRVGGAPLSTPPAENAAGGMSTMTAAALLGLGVALGWVGNQLSHRWRDRRQRIRL